MFGIFGRYSILQILARVSTEIEKGRILRRIEKFSEKL